MFSSEVDREVPLGERVSNKIPLTRLPMAFTDIVLAKVAIKMRVVLQNGWIIIEQSDQKSRARTNNKSRSKISLCDALSIHNWKNFINISIRSEIMHDKEIKNFGLIFAKYGTRLKNITLDLSQCTQLSDKDVEILASNIQSSLLKQMNLNFVGCNLISNRGIEILGFNMGRYLPQLQQLSLNFELCHQITDKGIGSLMHQITRTMPHLQQLILNFTNCYNVTDQGVEAVGSSVAHRSIKLKGLDLNFSLCDKVTHKGLEKLASDIATSQLQIQRLSLNFSCLNIRIIRHVREILHFIPNLIFILT